MSSALFKCHFLSTLLAFFAFEILLPMPGHAADRGQISCEVLLTQAQRQALDHAVTTGEYTTQILTGQVNGVSRTVVLLGESHWKSKSAGEIGNSVVEQFKYNGLESADTDKLWGGRLMSWLVDMAHRSGRQQQGHGSTMDDAVFAEKLDMGMRAIRAVVAEAESRKIDVKSVNIEEVVEKTIAETPQEGRQTFNLEKGHQPNLVENIGSILLPFQAFAATPLCTFSTCYFAFSALNGQPAVDAAVVAMSSFALRLLIRSKSWGDFWIGNPRNPTMAQNILKIFDSSAQIDQLLVIVGADHVKGIAECLKPAGFQP